MKHDNNRKYVLASYFQSHENTGCFRREWKRILILTISKKGFAGFGNKMTAMEYYCEYIGRILSEEIL